MREDREKGMSKWRKRSNEKLREDDVWFKIKNKKMKVNEWKLLKRREQNNVNEIMNKQIRMNKYNIYNWMHDWITKNEWRHKEQIRK